MADKETVFELVIGAGKPGDYFVALTRSPVGTACGTCILDPTDVALQADMQRLQSDNTNEQFLRDFGRRLFVSIFHDQVLAHFQSSLQSTQSGLSIHLRFDVPELAALPWELLYDPVKDSFLSISPLTSISRRLTDVGAVAVNLALPLKILLVLSGPKDLPGLDFDGEEKKIQAKLEKIINSGQVELQILKQATPNNIRQAMGDFCPHIFHYIGHGDFDKQNQTAQIVLEDEKSFALFMDERRFREFFNGQTQTRLVVLNACESGSTGSAHALSGLAPRLLQRDVPAVVAMQYHISDKSALIFSSDFYRSLVSGNRVDVAVAEGRRALYQDAGSDYIDWATPVLFLGSPAEKLFPTIPAIKQPQNGELSAELFEKIRDALSVCGPFQSDQQIRAIFIHPSLNPYRNQLPQASSVSARVEAIIGFLLDVEGPALLATLLRVLGTRWDPATACYHRLINLAKMIESSHNIAK